MGGGAGVEEEGLEGAAASSLGGDEMRLGTRPCFIGGKLARLTPLVRVY